VLDPVTVGIRVRGRQASGVWGRTQRHFTQCLTVTDPDILYCAAAVYLRVTVRSTPLAVQFSQPRFPFPSPFPPPFHTSLFTSTRDRPIYAYEHNIKIVAVRPSSARHRRFILSQHQASSIKHHESRITHHACGSFVLLSAAAAAAFKRPRPQTLPMCPLQASRLSAASTAPHHTTPVHHHHQPWLAQLD
jgi:hypothetical protein